LPVLSQFDVQRRAKARHHGVSNALDDPNLPLDMTWMSVVECCDQGDKERRDVQTSHTNDQDSIQWIGHWSEDILAIDPGRTSGIAYLTRGGEFRTTTSRCVEKYLQRANPRVVIIERFRWHGRGSPSRDAIEMRHLIDRLIILCGSRGIRAVMVEPRARVPFIGRARVLLAAVPCAQVSDHNEDAMAHLLAYLAQESSVDWHERGAA